MRCGTEEPRDVVQANQGEGSQTLRFHVHETPGAINPRRQSRPVAAGAGCGGAQDTGGCQGLWGFPLRGGDVLEPAELWPPRGDRAQRH